MKINLLGEVVDSVRAIGSECDAELYYILSELCSAGGHPWPIDRMAIYGGSTQRHGSQVRTQRRGSYRHFRALTMDIVARLRAARPGRLTPQIH